MYIVKVGIFHNFCKKRKFTIFFSFFRGGNGGHGLPQYGGHGGNGGSVILKTPVKDNKRNPTNLYTIFKKNFKGDPQKQKLEGKNGAASSKARLIGAKGEDVTLMVEIFT